MVNGDGNRDRMNLDLGVDLRHWFLDTTNYGLRFSFDLEHQTGTVRKVGLAPGIAQHWMPLEHWRPFLRFDLPVVLHGAANTASKSDQTDLGVSGGAGFVWKLG